MNNRTQVTLDIFSDLSHKEITEKLGVRPDVAINKGESPPNPRISTPSIQTQWTLSSELESEEDLNIHIMAIFDKLNTSKFAIKKLPEFSSQITIFISSDYRPEINFSAKTIQSISQIGSSIDVDFYYLGD